MNVKVVWADGTEKTFKNINRTDLEDNWLILRKEYDEKFGGGDISIPLTALRYAEEID